MNNIELLTTKGVTAISGMHDRIQDVKNLLEQRLNLEEYSENVRPITLSFSVVLPTVSWRDVIASAAVTFT